MSEMLANSYFISRNFSKALPLFEEELQAGRASDKVKKKLIICYLSVGRVDDAFRLFYELVNRDPDIIIKTDPYWDDCPCPEMVDRYEGKRNTLHSAREFLTLAILYLFCDINKSIQYLEQAAHLDPHNLKISSVLQRLQNKLQTT